MRIACLHTAASNVSVFDTAAVGLGVSLIHSVRADLLAAAETAGGLNDKISLDTERALDVLREGADAVILTCSTLGPAVTAFFGSEIPVLRADSALADRASGAAGRVVVLCAVATTVPGTTALFDAAARRSPAAPSLEVRLVEGAWDHFKAGHMIDYFATIASAADVAFADGATVVALAQASMTSASEITRNGRPLTSPGAALAAARDAVGTRQAGKWTR